MVGVPGRSRACQPCKTRRVACDLQLPECSRCVRAERQCRYPQGHIFVLANEGSHKTIYRKELAEQKNSPANAKRLRKRPDDDVCEKQLTAVSNGTSDHRVQSVVLSKTPGVAIVSQQALLARAIADGEGNSTATFSGALANSLASGHMGSLYSPLLACYTSWLGRRDRNSRLLNAGRELYICGLSETNQALICPRTMYADSTLASCHMLGIYEAIECPDDSMTGYHWHRAACYRLVQMRGPAAHKDGVAHELFTSFRVFGVLHALDNGLAPYLANPEWMTVPWSIHPKTTLDKVIDVVALATDVASIAYKIPSLPQDELLPTGLSILKRVTAIHTELRNFYSDLQSEHPGPLYWGAPLPAKPDEPGGSGSDSDFFFPPILCFPDLQLATTITTAWAIETMAWAGLADLYDLLSHFGMTDVFKSMLGEEIE